MKHAFISVHCNMSIEYPCRKSQFCIDKAKRCDGKIDCDKGEDELDCGKKNILIINQ